MKLLILGIILGALTMGLWERDLRVSLQEEVQHLRSERVLVRELIYAADHLGSQTEEHTEVCQLVREHVLTPPLRLYVKVVE